MPQVKVSVSVDDAHVSQIQKVAEALQSVGMEIERTLPGVGVISGSIASEQVDRLYKVAGVQHIEAERNYHLAPPDSDLQ